MNTIVLGRFAQTDRQHLAQGWAVSGIVHLLGVSAALLLVADLTLPAQPETFRWNVAMVEAPAPAVAEEPKPLEPPPPLPKKVEPTPLEHTPVVQSVQPVQQPVQQQQEVEAIHETGRPLMRPTQEFPATPEPLAQSTPMPYVQATARPAAHHQAAVDQQPTAQPQAAVARHSQEQPSAPTIVHRTAIREVTLRSYPQTQADYGWLSEALWNRIEQLKRYPALAKANHWEGKVVLEAVIRDDGAILALHVAESSGHSVLDLDALTVVKQASPLILKHPLGHSQVTILVPIAYKLDG